MQLFDLLTTGWFAINGDVCVHVEKPLYIWNQEHLENIVYNVLVMKAYMYGILLNSLPEDFLTD